MIVLVYSGFPSHCYSQFPKSYISYNGLGERWISCPPQDWRSPNVVDMYNVIIEEVCKKFSVPFIDTQSITGIMWERAADWCHYRDISGEMEAVYFLQKENMFF